MAYSKSCFLFVSQVDFYTRFCVAHLDVHISLCSFSRLKLYFAYKLKDFNSYCCKTDQEMMEVKADYNNMKSMASHNGEVGEICICSCTQVCANPPNGCVIHGLVDCCAMSHSFKRSSNLWQLVVCPI
jgi:hypothetical protein